MNAPLGKKINCCWKHNQEIGSQRAQGQSSGLSEKSWGRYSWGSQPVGVARRQRKRPDVVLGIVTTEWSCWSSTCVMHLIVWERIHFCLWRLLEPKGLISPIGRPNWTCTLYSIGWWSSPMCPVWIQCVVFERCFPRRLPGEGSRRFSGITGEAQSNWLGGQWKQMWAHILNDSMTETTEALFLGLFSGVRVVEACDLSLLGALVDIRGIPGRIHEEMEALERMTSKLELLNPHQAFVLLKNAFAIPKLQYVLRASPATLYREELRVFDRALFYSLGRVANESLEGMCVNRPGSQWVLAVLVVGEQEISPCLLSLPLWTLWASWWKYSF